MTDNRAIDALPDMTGRNFDVEDPSLENTLFNQEKVVLVTAHRQENCKKRR